MAILMIWLIQWICCVLSQQLDVYNCKGKPISLMEVGVYLLISGVFWDFGFKEIDKNLLH